MSCVVCKKPMHQPKRNQYTCGDQFCINTARWFVENGDKDAYFKRQAEAQDRVRLDECWSRVFRGLAA